MRRAQRGADRPRAGRPTPRRRPRAMSSAKRPRSSWSFAVRNPSRPLTMPDLHDAREEQASPACARGPGSCHPSPDDLPKTPPIRRTGSGRCRRPGRRSPCPREAALDVAVDLARRLEGRRAAADRPGPALALAGSVPGARPLACGSSGSSRHDPVQYALPYDLCHGVARSMCKSRYFLLTTIAALRDS